MKQLFFFLFLLCFYINAFSKNIESVKYENSKKPINIGNFTYWLEDTDGSLSWQKALLIDSYNKSNEEIHNFGGSNSVFWIKFKILNSTHNPSLLLQIPLPVLNEIKCFILLKDSLISENTLGESHPFNYRSYAVPDFLFDVICPLGKEVTCLLRIDNTEQTQVPLILGSPSSILVSIAQKEFFLGIYFGIIFIMFFYNLFIWFSVRDNTYLYYVAYLLLFGLMEAVLFGYFNQYICLSCGVLAENSMTIISALAGIAVFLFIKSFLHTFHFHKINTTIYFIILIYILSIVISFLHFYSLGFLIMQANSLVGAILAFGAGVLLFKRGQKQAKFFLLAWSVLIFFIVVFLLCELGILPLTHSSIYLITIGSGIEAILLSFALADRINILKKDNEEKNNKIISQLKENERYLISWQEAVIQVERLKHETVYSQFETLKNQEIRLLN